MSLIQLDFESQYLGGNTQVSIILPDRPNEVDADAFFTSHKRFKVLWLLHGAHGDHSDWVRKSSIEIYARENDLIVVMPSALNSGYINWPGCMQGMDMYRYFLDELMPMVHNWLPASAAREDNYIAGLSMGGGGTLIYALNHPEKFAAAAVLSMAPANYKRLIEEPDPDPESLFAKILAGRMANAGGKEALLNSVGHTWRTLGEKVGKEDLPPIYCTIGTEDFLYGRYCEFKAYAQELGADIVFEEYEGYGHEWRFWDMAIQKALTFFGLDE